MYSYLVGVTVVLDVSAAGSAFAVIEVPPREGHCGEVPGSRVEVAPASAAGSRSHTVPTHVIDHGVHVDMDLKGSASTSGWFVERQTSAILVTTVYSMTVTLQLLGTLRGPRVKCEGKSR